MGALTAVVGVATNKFKKDDGGKISAQGFGQALMNAVMPTSYDTGGSVLDLSKYLVGVPAMVHIPAKKGVVFEYIPGVDAATGKVKAYNSTPAHTHTSAAHTHDILALGGAAAAGTNVLQSLTGSIQKQEAANATLAGDSVGGVKNIQPTTPGVGGSTTTALGTEVTATTDLSSITLDIIAYGQLA